VSGFVYKWTNTINGKWYYGSHKGCHNDGYIGSGKIFLIAYKKHKNNFVREILYTGEHFRELEEFILETLDAANDRKSYNMKNSAIGGDTSMHFTEQSIIKMSEASKKRDYSAPMPQEQRDKIRKKRLGTKATPETKKKLSQIRMGKGNPFYGKTHSEETKIKISKAKKGRKLSKDIVNRRASKIRKKILHQQTGLIFESIKDAGLHFGLHQSTISNMLNGHIRNRFDLCFLTSNQNTITLK